MKEKQNKRWGLKLVSLLSAFLVWLAVVNVADPVMTSTVEVPIEILNEQILTDNGLAYEISGKSSTAVSYEVNTTNAYRVRSTDFRAYADLAELWSVTGSVPVKVEIVNNQDLIRSIPISRVSTIKIVTEPIQLKRFELNPVLLGEIEDGYKAGEISLTPNHVYVEGPQSLVGQISGAGVEIDMDGASADASGTAKICYYDANGNKIILNQKVTARHENSDYQVQLLKVKSLALDYEVTGTVADRYRFTGVETDRRNIEVIGLKSTLASLNTLTISGDALNIEGANGTIEKTIDLNQYLPEGVTLANGEDANLNVTITVERLEDRVYQIEVNDSCLTGKVEGYLYEPAPDSINVRVRALEEELAVLELDSSDIEIDVSRMDEGVNGATVVLKTELDPVYEVIYVTICNINVTQELAGPGAMMNPDFGESESEAEDAEKVDSAEAQTEKTDNKKSDAAGIGTEDTKKTAKKAV